MKMRLLTYILSLVFIIGTTSCIEDGITTSPSSQPAYSVDTLKLGEVYTLESTPTRRFTVYNHNDKILNISSISLRDDADDIFRLNVDGFSGETFSDIEIRPNDSIYVFVEATPRENGTNDLVDIKRHLDFITNGVTSTVVVTMQSQDVTRLQNNTIDSDTRFVAGKPYIITDTLYVKPSATLTLEAGARVRLHDAAAIKVEGTLLSKGTADNQVEIVGDRTGNVAAEIPYELMSGQWGGIYFTATSHNNHLSYTSIRNSSNGLTITGTGATDSPALTLYNCQVRNTTNYIIDAQHSSVKVVGCELADAANGIVRLVGGSHIFNHCTIANYYLFSVLGGAAIQFEHLNADNDDGSGMPYLIADFTNSIIYGNGSELSHGDLTGTSVTLRRCLFKVAGTDDANFIECLWESDPLYYTVRNEYLFDYRLKPESPAIGASNMSYDIYEFNADRYGVAVPSPADLGAYVYVAPAE